MDPERRAETQDTPPYHATRRHIAKLRQKEPEVTIEIRWCPSHQGIEGNESADEGQQLSRP